MSPRTAPALYDGITFSGIIAPEGDATVAGTEALRAVAPKSPQER